MCPGLELPANSPTDGGGGFQVARAENDTSVLAVTVKAEKVGEVRARARRTEEPPGGDVPSAEPDAVSAVRLSGPFR